PVSIQGNLYLALLHLRDLNKDMPGPFMLWADAICVNQQDNVGKSHQVQQMKQIYENASKVIVWLG
ncbi:hypothetical protein DL98DRAFT_372665, partial [Cadophora sp. DSE1049]